MSFNCPHCNKPIDNSLISSESAKIRGAMTTPLKSKKSAANGRHGGRPVGSKDSVKRVRAKKISAKKN